MKTVQCCQVITVDPSTLVQCRRTLLDRIQEEMKTVQNIDFLVGAKQMLLPGLADEVDKRLVSLRKSREDILKNIRAEEEKLDALDRLICNMRKACCKENICGEAA